MRVLIRWLTIPLVIILALTGARIAASLLIAAPSIPASDPEADIPFQDNLTRSDVRFPCGDGVCAGWLFQRPDAARRPIVILGHGFAGTRDVVIDDFAREIAAAGYAALVFDYRHFGASSGAPRQVIDVSKQLEDWAAAVAYVRTLTDVDGSKIALWGSSLGGGHALITAARIPEVDAVVAMAPLIDTREEGEGAALSITAALRLLITAWWDLYQAPFTGEAVTIPSMAPKGKFAMLSDDAAFAAFETLVEPGSSYRNAVAARSILFFDDYNPAVMATEIKIPVLLIASPVDRFAPFSAVEAFADTRSNVRIAEFPGDHFGVYKDEARGLAFVSGTAFLAEAGFPPKPSAGDGVIE